MDAKDSMDGCEYMYVFGEAQSALLAAQEEIFAFARENMAAISTPELESVLANVFGAGQLFPGPDTALGALIHEYASRSARKSELVAAGAAAPASGYCLLILVFKGQEGDMRVRSAARLTVDTGKNPLEDDKDAYQLVLEKLPAFQHIFLEDACAPQSRLIGLIKASALLHINKKLD